MSYLILGKKITFHHSFGEKLPICYLFLLLKFFESPENRLKWAFMRLVLITHAHWSSHSLHDIPDLSEVHRLV